MERIIDAAGTRLSIDELGDPAGPPVVQLEGHMAQLVSTPQSYCERLVEHGLRVVRVDNRDVGRSARCPQPYTLLGMAEDVHALIEALGRPAVVLGRSMGGAIAQLLTLAHPDDVIGLGLLYTYAKEGPRPTRAEQEAPFHDEESFIAWEQDALPRIAGSGYPLDEAEIDALARLLWARGADWAGFQRQAHASELTPPWAERLGEISVPTLILHGEEDPVIPVEAAYRLHALIPSSTLRLVPRLGHQQPPGLDDLFVEATLDLVRRATDTASPH